MSTGDNTDMFGRLKNLLPVGWFGDNNPILEALLWGYANALAWGYTLYLYAKNQTRIKTASDGWLDLIGLDFFGTNLVRYSNQLDSSYRNRILINLFRERTTRPAMARVLYDLTGRWPIIVEPGRPADVGSYGAAVAVQRASTATYFDLNGLLATAPPNVARYDAGPVTGVSGLLIEESRTNFFLQSENLTASNWSKSGYTVTAGEASIKGGTQAFRLTPTANGTSPQLFQAPAAGGVVQTVSFIVSSAGAAAAYIQLQGATSNNSACRALLNLATGAVTAVTYFGSGFSGGVASSASLGAGRWLFTLSAMTLAGENIRGLLGPSTSASSATSVNTTDMLIAECPQFENGAFRTSYIPTTAASVARAADTQINNMPAGSIAIGGYGVAGTYGSLLHPYQAFITAFRPNGQGLPFVAGYGISTGAYSTPSRSTYGQLSVGDVTDADIFAAIDATKPIGSVAWTRISS